ncbi:hypothetical protein SLEP1_g17694 [Rubroshorea leprosula]|uniref:GST C-terminal domain-containing protein n=1 Tax=Rubroshorea leprosula TaxID=152421 RepID=A0AAV5J2N0_9ROSI|nr:hypothetical protein SLEP1_g17694 [Rubroshorea leprosula]
MPSMLNDFKVEGQEQEEAIGSAMENLKVLEEELRGKKFFGGEKIGFADLAYGWLANLMSVFEENTGIKMIDEESFPSLSGWIQAFSDTPKIKESWPSHDKLVAKVSCPPREIRCCNIQMNQLVRLCVS